jgi:hypothetical protein
VVVASAIYLIVVDPALGAVVSKQWIGGQLTRDKVRSVLDRPPDSAPEGVGEYWGHVTAAEALEVSTTAYESGAGPTDVEELAGQFPADTHWWVIEHDY